MERELALVAEASRLGEARAFVEAWAAAAGLGREERYRVVVAANEAVSNAIEHGRPHPDGTVRLSADLAPDRLVLVVGDGGRFADSSGQDADAIAERGRGFAFINLLMDDVELDAGPEGTVVRLTKWLAEPAPRADARAAEPANVAAARELMDAFARRDTAALTEAVDRGVMFEPLSTPVRRRVPYLGHAGLRRYLADLEDTWDELRVTIESLHPREDFVVALGRISGAAGPVRLEAAAAFVWRFRSGRAVWGKVYDDEDDAFRAAGMATRPQPPPGTGWPGPPGPAA